MHVVLAHGMGRSPLALSRLGRRLRDAGHTTSFFAYSVRTSTLSGIAHRFARETRDATSARYAVIGHSLGNIIYRMAERDLTRLPEQVVMLAPPNQGSAAARLLDGLPALKTLFGVATGDAGRKMADPTFAQSLPVPSAPVTVFAGDRGPRLAQPFGGAPNDGVVAVDETFLTGADHEVVPALHTFIMNDARVVHRTLELLRR